MISLAAHLAALLGALAIAVAVLGPIGAMFGIWPPLTGFALFVFAVIPGTLLTMLLSLLGLLRTRTGSGRGGASQAWAGLVMAALLTVLWGFTLVSVSGKPMIHDITTDLDDPPTFAALAQDPANQNRDLTYPHGVDSSAPAEQRTAYPDLEPIRLDVSPERALDRALAAADDLGWTVVAVDRDSRTLEAYDETAIFRFVDDVAVRVRPADGGSIVDVRSTSRVGQGDLGANADRIRAFRYRLSRTD